MKRNRADGNLYDTTEKKQVHSIIAVLELDEKMDAGRMLLDKDYLKEHISVKNTFTSINDLKLFYHDVPHNGRLNDRERAGVSLILFDAMLLFVQVMMFLENLCEGKAWGFALGSVFVIFTCLVWTVRTVKKDWGD